MRRWLGLFSGFAAVARPASLVLMASCFGAMAMRGGGDRAVAAHGSVHFYYKSQIEADADLDQFDRANPRCDLWTNWQKICSRTGPDGSTHCQADPERRVRPSTPFCVYRDGDVDYHFLDGPEAGSAERYCRNRMQVSVSSGRAAGDVRSAIRCVGYSRQRPFNGHRLAARLHPWCQEWSDTYTERPVCSVTAPRASGRNCATLAARRYQHPRPLYCSRWVNPSSCAEPASLLDRPAAPTPGTIIVNDGRSEISNLPVHGVLCRRKASNAE